MIYYENVENRVCILYPYMGKVLIGSTDIPVSDMSDIRCSDEEVDYILQSLQEILPSIDIDKNQIVYKFSGVRPLGAASKATAGQIPRSHQLQVSNINGQPVISLVGGKWTTFRAFAEQATDQVLVMLNEQRICSTRDRPIGGGKNYPTNGLQRESYVNKLCERYGLTLSPVQVLFNRYGTDVEKLLDFAKQGPLTPLTTIDVYFAEEIQYLVEFESSLNLEDLVVRRTNLAIEGQLNNQVLIELARLMKQPLGWNESTLIEQLENCCQRLSDENGCDLQSKVIASQYKKIKNTGESLCL